MHGTHGHEWWLVLPIENGKSKDLKVMCDAVWAEFRRMPKISRYRGRDSQRCRGVSTVAGDDGFQNGRRTFRVSEMQQQRYERVAFGDQFRCAFPGMAWRQD